MDVSSASRLWYLKHSRPIPPVMVNTSGVKDACSTSKTRRSYILFFSFSWRRYNCSGVRSLYESAFGWHTLMSKKVDFCLSQNPRAWMSRQGSQAKFAPLFKVSPVISCRAGSVFTSLQTRSSRSASRSRNSLWRWIIKPPRLQIMAWSTLKRSPHTQTVGVPIISQSYLRWIASLSSLLFRSLSVPLLGITVNQFDAPFSLAKLTALFVLAGREFLHSSDRVWKGGPDPTFPPLFHENPASRTFFISCPNPAFLSQKNTLKGLISTKANTCKI